MTRHRIVVTAALVERDHAFLVTRRPDGTHLGGHWEFPGGKCEPGETLEECLLREMLEELGVAVIVCEEEYATSHAYEDRDVELHFFRCELRGDPRPCLGQEIRWVPRAGLSALEFPPADAELIARLGQRG
jgi:8-oxo-dGTP diphosphatase